MSNRDTESMDVDIYQSGTTLNRFLIVRRGVQAEARLPDEVRDEFAISSPFKQVTLNHSTPLIGLDVESVLESLTSAEYCIVGVSINVIER